jgi:GTPase SAR1 family protein
LRVRVVTTKITENVYNIQGGVLVYDVGGQRGLRKQWMSYFDLVHGIVFVTDIASFDQTLMEDPTVNRITDALELFKTIVNAPLLLHVSMILLLNKTDLLKKKLLTVSFKTYFPEFTGIFIGLIIEEQTASNCIKHFRKLFLLQNHRGNTGASVIPYATCCTDSHSMEKIVNTVM